MECLRTIFVCLTLEVGVLFGVPMKPEEIEKLLREMNQPTLAHTLPSDEEEGDGRRDEEGDPPSPLTASADDLVQPVEGSGELLFGRAPETGAQAIDGKRADLADLQP